MTSITNNTYQNLPYNPENLASNVVNGPFGPVSYTLGNGLNVERTYDTLGRLAGMFVCSGPAAVSCSGGTQVYGTATTRVGTNVVHQSDTLLNQQVTFGYGDGLNRLTSRTVTAGTQQNYTYSYDRNGNRLTQTALQTGYSFLPTFNAANNQITTPGFSYDAAGNMTHDSVHSYTYDAEGNITAVDGGVTGVYVYDAFNHRVHTQTGSGTVDYLYDYAGRRISSWTGPASANEGRIYWGGQQFAYRSVDGTTYFDHQDTLGTERMRTNYAGGVASTYTSLPWGDDYTAAVNNSGGDQDNEHFALLEYDTESGTEHAQFRNYASAQGRWLSPDRYLGSYDLTNPQSFNRYAYALNNPMSYLDPSGLDECDDAGSCPSTSDADDPGTQGGGYGGGENPPDCSSDSTVCVTAGPPDVPEPCDAVACFPGGTNPTGTSNGPDRPTPGAPSSPTQPGKQSKTACNAQRVANAIPNATLTGLNGSQGGHEEYGIQVSGGALAGAGFSFYTTPFGNGNGYRTPFSGAHVNGQNGTGQSVNMAIQYAYGASFAGQAHFDVGNASSGFGGFLEHSIVDVVLGTLLGWIPGLHNFLDPGC